MTQLEPKIVLFDPEIDGGAANLTDAYAAEDASYHPAGDIPCEALAALRRLRDNLREVGGARLVAIADEALCDRLAIRVLQRESGLGCIGHESERTLGASSQLAEAIMLNAADTCSRSSTTHAACRSIFFVMLMLLDRLVEGSSTPLTPEHLIDALSGKHTLVSSAPFAVSSLGAIRKSRSRSKQFRQSSAM